MEDLIAILKTICLILVIWNDIEFIFFNKMENANFGKLNIIVWNVWVTILFMI